MSIIRSILRLITLVYPFYRGGVKISQSSLYKYFSSKDELRLVSLRNGLKVLIQLNDYCGRTIYFWGDYDRKITYLCEKVLRPGDCFLDIGANYGEVGLCAAKAVGANGVVHIFEPQKKLANYIRISSEINAFNHVHVHEVALADKAGEACLSIPSDNSGAASLTEIKEGKLQKINVQTVNTSEYLNSLGSLKVRAIKLDVEGFEETIIREGLDFFSKTRPIAIIFESHDDGSTFFERGAVRLMSELDYSFFQVRQKSLFRVELLEIPFLHGPTESGYDFIAILKSDEGSEIVNQLCVVTLRNNSYPVGS